MATFSFSVADSEFNDGQPAQGTEVRARDNDIRTFLLGSNLDASDNINPAMTPAWTGRHSWTVSDANNHNLSLTVSAVMAASKYGIRISSSAAQVNSALVYVTLTNASSTVPCLELVDAGTGATVSITKTGNGAAFTGTQSGAAATIAPFVASQAGTGPLFSGTLRSLASLSAPMLAKVATTAQQISNDATETVFNDLNLTLPANFLKAGTTFRGQVWGTMDSPGAGAATCRLRVYYGGIAGTVLLDSGAFAPAVSLANSMVRFDFLVTCLTTGGAGTVEAQGDVVWNNNSIPVHRGMGTAASGAGNPAAVTIDTTVQKDLTIAFKFGSAVVGSVFNFRAGSLEVLK